MNKTKSCLDATAFDAACRALVDHIDQSAAAGQRMTPVAHAVLHDLMRRAGFKGGWKPDKQKPAGAWPAGQGVTNCYGVTAAR